MILAVFDHLWQSSLFAVIVGLLALTMRTNRASTRFSLWFAASLKFLVPLSLFVGIGKLLGWQTSISSQWSLVISGIVRPSSMISSSQTAFSSTATYSYGPYVLLAVWLVGFTAVVTRWYVEWKRIKAIVRGAIPIDLGCPIDTRLSSSVLEPGVVGIREPILLLPADIETHLAPAQLRSVVDHELCHVRRRDNLSSALHMFIEALFWFYPLLWWIGTRLIEERERACDEAVLRSGNAPGDYAEGILKVCKTYLSSRLACTSGVSGGELAKRIEYILSNRMVTTLSLAKRVLVAAACSAALLGPVAVGVFDGRPARAQSGSPSAQGTSRVKYVDSGIRISADAVRESGNGVRYTGNVVLEVLPGSKGPMKIDAHKATDLRGDTVAKGNLKIDNTVRARLGGSMLLEGGVQIEVDGRTFITERAIASPSTFKMESMEALPRSAKP